MCCFSRQCHSPYQSFLIFLMKLFDTSNWWPNMSTLVLRARVPSAYILNGLQDTQSPAKCSDTEQKKTWLGTPSVLPLKSGTVGFEPHSRPESCQLTDDMINVPIALTVRIQQLPCLLNYILVRKFNFELFHRPFNTLLWRNTVCHE